MKSVPFRFKTHFPGRRFTLVKGGDCPNCVFESRAHNGCDLLNRDLEALTRDGNLACITDEAHYEEVT